MISHEQAAAIALALLEAGVEGADIIAAYVDQQSQPKPWEALSDREWSNIAAKRAYDASNMVAALVDRVRALECRDDDHRPRRAPLNSARQGRLKIDDVQRALRRGSSRRVLSRHDPRHIKSRLDFAPFPSADHRRGGKQRQSVK